MTSPSYTSRSKLLRALPPLTVLICSTTIMATGSRVGLLGLGIALPTLLWGRWPQLRQRKRWSTIIAATLVFGCGAGTFMSDGLFRAYSKLERLTEEGLDVRPHIYRIAWSLYAEKPIAGHGIGSFQSVFHQRAGEYMAERGSEPLIGHSRFSHPHNELLFWAIEGGSLALLGIVLATGTVLIQLWRQGRQRGMALLSLLLPISLHTQVELPFYSSTYHWLIYLFLLFLVFCHAYRSVPLKLSRAAIIMIPSTGLVVTAIILATMASTYSASRHLTQYMLSKDPDIHHLQSAQKNLYFNEICNLLMYKALLYTDFANNTQKWVNGYIEWSETYLAKTPETSSFSDLALAYRHAGRPDKAQETLARGLFLYPQHPDILKTKNLILHNQPAISADKH